MTTTTTPTDMKIFALVDDAWYAETKGELALNNGHDLFDPELCEFVLTLFRNARTNIESDATRQVRRDGTEIIEEVTDAEIAQRVCRALTTLWWGW